MILHLLSWLALVALVWVFRLSYIGWLGPWLLSVVIAVPLGMLAISLPSMLKLRISLRSPALAVRGKATKYTLAFHSSGLLPVHSVTVHLQLHNRFTGEVSKENYIFRNIETSTSELPLPVGLCGVVTVKLLRFEVTDAMGMFSIRRKLDARCECAVLPEAIAPEAPVSFDAALTSSDVLKPKYGGGFAEDHDLRGYRPGDPPNSIHWKLSSKMDDLIVREALVPENSTVYVVLERVGENDRGLELLRWLSHALLEREEPHTIVADVLYAVSNEEESDRALASLLSAPMREPCGFDPRAARCVFTVCAGEVKVG